MTRNYTKALEETRKGQTRYLGMNDYNEYNSNLSLAVAITAPPTLYCPKIPA